MASDSPANDPGTPSSKQPSPASPTPPTTQPAAKTNGDGAAPAQSAQGPQRQQYFFNREPPHDGATAEPGGAVPVPFHGMPMFSYPGGSAMTRPKRTQCKNACTNCQKACKKCDDNRPCHRCIRYGITDTCVDSKRKERKKGVKRGPYKKRDSKGHNADAENDDSNGAGSANGTHGPSPLPYVGPVGYPPGMWSAYAPGGPGAKIEGGGYYQPIFALTPVAGQGPHGGEGENGGSGEGPPHFPVGFYPATFISYPGPYPPYPMPPPGQGGSSHGFHFAYPPGVFARPPNVVVSNPAPTGESGAATSGSADSQKDVTSSAAAGDVDKGEPKDTTKEPQINGKAKVAEANSKE